MREYRANAMEPHTDIQTDRQCESESEQRKDRDFALYIKLVNY